MRLFEAIPKIPSSGDEALRFAAEAIPGYERYHVARDAEGDPALLITGLPGRAPERPAPIVLEHLAVQADVDCVIQRSDGKRWQDRCVVVRCRNGDRRLQEYFLRSAAAVAVAVGQEPTPKQIRDAVDTLVELFRVMATAPKKSIQGLWAELFVMWQARDSVTLARAWHIAPEERYDFCAGDQRLEVKSASQHQRSHEFSLEQIRPPATVQVVVASLFVETSAGGVSLRDLAEAVRDGIAHYSELALQFDRVLGTVLGSAWRSASESRFDVDLAGPANRSRAIPASVSGVHFRSDLSHSQPADLSVLLAAGGVLGAAVAESGGRGGRRR